MKVGVVGVLHSCTKSGKACTLGGNIFCFCPHSDTVRSEYYLIALFHVVSFLCSCQNSIYSRHFPLSAHHVLCLNTHKYLCPCQKGKVTFFCRVLCMLVCVHAFVLILVTLRQRLDFIEEAPKEGNALQSCPTKRRSPVCGCLAAFFLLFLAASACSRPPVILITCH